MHLEANNNSRTASTAPTVTTRSTSPQEASNRAAKTVNKNKEKFTAAAQSQNEEEEEEEEEVFLPTAIVSVDNNGKTTDIRELILETQDPKATSSRKMQHNTLVEKKTDGRVFGLGVQEANNSKGSVNLILKTKDEDFINVRATALAILTSNLPSHHVNVSGWTKLQNLSLADPNFNQPFTVDLIIGARHYEELIIGDNRIKEPQKSTTYRLSCFGWLLMRRESQLEKKNTQLESFFICSEPDNLQRFWEI